MKSFSRLRASRLRAAFLATWLCFGGAGFLVDAAGCSSLSACARQLGVKVNLDSQSSAADMLTLELNAENGVARTFSSSHAPGATSAGFTVVLPEGFPTDRAVTVTVEALEGGKLLGRATTRLARLPLGCAAGVTLTFGLGEPGAGGAGGGGGRGFGGPGGGGASGSAPANPGGTGGSAPTNLGGDCNGSGDEGCACAGGATRDCGPTAVGICKPGTQTCAGNEWGRCERAVNKAARDCTSSLDNDCDGLPDNTLDTVCVCAVGSTRTCGAHAGNDGKGSCTAGSQACVLSPDKTSSAYSPTCTGSIGPAAADTCEMGNDANCNGKLNEGCLCINGVTKHVCGACGDGSQTCTDGKTETFGACTGGTAQDFTALGLNDGWLGGAYNTSAPAISRDCAGVVHLKGGIAGGTTMEPFTIPAGLRPSARIHVPLDMFEAARGALQIEPSGKVTLRARDDAADAVNFASLEGVSYPLATAGFSPLSLSSGWSAYAGDTRGPAVSVANGVVRLQGALAQGTSENVFTLPSGHRPTSLVFVSVTLGGSAQGRLIIYPSGVTTVQAEGALSDAQGFLSLEGVWFPVSPSGWTALTPASGWSAGAAGGRLAAAALDNGTVRLMGALKGETTAGRTLFTLPVGMRPAAAVFTPLGLCDARKGRLLVEPSGNVSYQIPFDVTEDYATCFISLEGASFGL